MQVPGFATGSDILLTRSAHMALQGSLSGYQVSAERITINEQSRGVRVRASQASLQCRNIWYCATQFMRYSEVFQPRSPAGCRNGRSTQTQQGGDSQSGYLRGVQQESHVRECRGKTNSRRPRTGGGVQPRFQSIDEMKCRCVITKREKGQKDIERLTHTVALKI